MNDAVLFLLGRALCNNTAVFCGFAGAFCRLSCLLASVGVGVGGDQHVVNSKHNFIILLFFLSCLNKPTKFTFRCCFYVRHFFYLDTYVCMMKKDRLSCSVDRRQRATSRPQGWYYGCMIPPRRPDHRTQRPFLPPTNQPTTSEGKSSPW